MIKADKYHEDNIMGLVVTRGGTEKYKITAVYKRPLRKVKMRMSRNGRVYVTNLDVALQRLNNSKWEVFTNSQIVEQVYQIY